MIQNPIGVVDNIKHIETFPNMLVRFTLIVGSKTINCICGDRQIGNSLMFLENAKTEVAVYGTYNERNQLVIKKLFIRNPNDFERHFAMAGSF